MDICVLPAWFYDVQGQGGGIFFREQALALQPHLERIDIFYPALHLKYWNNTQQLHRRIDNLDEYIFQAPTPPKRGLFLKWFRHNIQSGFKWYINARGGRKPDLIHAHSFWGAYAALIIKQEFGVPYIYTEHLGRWAGATPKISPFYRRSLPHLIEQAQYASAVSGDLAHHLSTFAQPKKICVTPNLVDTDFFHPLHTVYKDATAFKLISIGDPWYTKGLDIILEALALLPADIKQRIHLSLVDKIPNRQKLFKLIKRYQLEQTVHFRGRLARAQLRELLQEQDLLISASRNESFGISMIEALACGVPVIASRTAGAKDIVHPEVGILVDIEAPEQIAKAILSIYKQITVFHSSQLVAYAKRKYGPTVFYERWLDIYQNAINQSP